MHKSRIGEITIDCQTDDLEDALRFWSAALGLKARRYEDANFNAYSFDTEANEIDINLQMVNHESRVHINIGPFLKLPELD